MYGTLFPNVELTSLDCRVTVAPAASRFPMVATSGALPRNSLASSATGGASLISTGRPRLLSRRQLVRRSFIPSCVARPTYSRRVCRGQFCLPEAGITARRKVVSAGSRHIAVSVQRWKTAQKKRLAAASFITAAAKALSLFWKSETVFSLSRNEKKWCQEPSFSGTSACSHHTAPAFAPLQSPPPTPAAAPIPHSPAARDSAPDSAPPLPHRR